MIDFIRLSYRDKDRIEPFIMREENFKTLYTVLEYHSGEIQYPYKTSLENMEIVINKQIVCLKNSIHKLYNTLEGNGNHNHNDFKYSSLCNTIDFLLENLLDLDTAIITQLEFGININTNKPAELIIRENLLMHKTKKYSHNLKFKGKGEFMQFDYDNYFIKIYDKAKQYAQGDNILRFEIKFIRKREFNKMGIKNISHLKSKSILRKLLKYLLKRLDEMIIVDDLTSIKRNSEDLKLLKIYCSSKYWEDTDRNYSRQTKMKRLRAFNNLLIKHKLLQTKNQLRVSLVQKFEYLINN